MKLTVIRSREGEVTKAMRGVCCLYIPMMFFYPRPEPDGAERKQRVS